MPKISELPEIDALTGDEALAALVEGSPNATGKLLLPLLRAWVLADLAAAGVAVTPVGGIAATDVQAALAELDSEKAAASALGALAALSSVGSGQIDAAAVTLAKMADLAAGRIIGRSSGTGVPEALTLSQVLDLVGGAADGDLLIRAAGAWTRLAKGVDGQVLRLGSGLPAWSAPGGVGDLELIDTINTTSGSSQVATNIPPCSEFVVFLEDVSGTTTAHVQLNLSDDNGSTWSSNWMQTDTQSAAFNRCCRIGILNAGAVGTKYLDCFLGGGAATSYTNARQTLGVIDAMRLTISSGSFDNGRYRIMGRKI